MTTLTPSHSADGSAHRTSGSPNAVAIIGHAVVFAALLAAGGCRVKSPTLDEQRELVRRGAFPSGTPGWMASQTGLGTQGRAGFGGLIPQVFSTPAESTSGSSQLLATIEQQTAERERRLQQEQLDRQRADDRSTQALSATGVKDEKDSPLNRINRACPGIESQVNEALTTIDIEQRIAKYVTLTNRCPHSFDLWLWLGKDYEKRNKLVQASRCYEKALVLNNQSEEASRLLEQSRRKLGSESKPRAQTRERPVDAQVTE